jgi:hypothetical protein
VTPILSFTTLCKRVCLSDLFLVLLGRYLKSFPGLEAGTKHAHSRDFAAPLICSFVAQFSTDEGRGVPLFPPWAGVTDFWLLHQDESLFYQGSFILK